MSAAYNAVQHNSLDRRPAAGVRFIGRVARRVPAGIWPGVWQGRRALLQTPAVTHYAGNDARYRSARDKTTRLHGTSVSANSIQPRHGTNVSAKAPTLVDRRGDGVSAEALTPSSHAMGPA
ncbi:hypothetical protein EMIT0111MI5_190087 [Burkholderia sp. IT-111MI5]